MKPAPPVTKTFLDIPCSISVLAFRQGKEILSIAGHHEVFTNPTQLLRIDESAPSCDFLNAGDIETLAGLNGLYVLGRPEHSLRRARIQPGHAAAKQFDIKVTGLEVFIIDGSDFNSPLAEGFTDLAISTTRLS